MKYRQLEKFLSKYFHREIHQKLVHYDLVMDIELIISTITFLLEANYLEALESEGEIDFNNLQSLDYAYTKLYPMHFREFGDEATTIFFILMDFYGFLRKENKITEVTYQRALATFVWGQEKFLEGMNNDKYWSKEKKEYMNDWDDQLEAMLGDDFLELADQFFSEEPAENQKSGKKSSTNIIPVDFGGSQAKLSKVPKPATEKINVYQLRIDLKGFKPPIWRRVLVPVTVTFKELHETIQQLFEWQNYHLYCFQLPFKFQNDIHDAMVAAWYALGDDIEKEYVGPFLEHFGKLEYVYDFGDDWEHTIKLEKILLPEETPEYDLIPRCIKGNGDAPMEDTHANPIYISYDIDEINDRL